MNKFSVLILIGLTLRIVTSLVTYHPDTHFMVLSNYLVNTRGLVLNFYDFLGQGSDPLSDALPASAFTYPPAGILLNSLLTAIPYWMIGGDFIEQWIISPEVAQSSKYFWLILFTKIPYLLADLGIGYLLYKLTFNNYKVLIFWILNPVSLYAAYAVGQFDLLPTFFAVAAVYLAQIKRPVKSAFILGLGGACKMFPILLLPALILSFGNNLQDKIKIAIFGFLGYAAIVAPYFFLSPGFRTFAILSPQSDKMFFAKINLTGSEYLSIFMIAYAVTIGLFVLYKRNFYVSILGILISFFSLTHYHPQWMVWITPFVILSLYQYPKLKIYWVLWFLSFLVVVFNFDQSLNWGITIFTRQLPDFTSIIPPTIEINKYVSLVRSFAAGVGLMIVTVILHTPRPVRNLNK